MLARVSTYLPTDEKRLWSMIESPASLQYVAAPILSFIPVEKDTFEKPWKTGAMYDLNLYLFKRIPLGRHRIQLVKIDRENNRIVSEEYGRLTRVWNHTITFRQSGDQKVEYTDLIEIEAGLLTPVIWAFAHLFYRHRQNRWKSLLQQTRQPA